MPPRLRDPRPVGPHGFFTGGSRVLAGGRVFVDTCGATVGSGRLASPGTRTRTVAARFPLSSEASQPGRRGRHHRDNGGAGGVDGSGVAGGPWPDVGATRRGATGFRASGGG